MKLIYNPRLGWCYAWEWLIGTRRHNGVLCPVQWHPDMHQVRVGPFLTALEAWREGKNLDK